jgi:hypothetical protein
MKKVLTLFAVAAALSFQSRAQAPLLFNYQGVARNGVGAPIAAAPIGLRISILEGSPSGTVVYQETQTATTNTYGLYTVSVGGGTVVSGTMSGVNWASGEKFMSVEIDPAGGSSYMALGTSQLLSVPYAMYAASTPASISGTVNRVVKFTGPKSGGNSQIFDNDTIVAINTPAPVAYRQFQVTAATGMTNAARIMLGTPPSTSIATAGGVYGESGAGIGVIGVSGTQNGVYGLSTGTLGGTVGVATGTGYGIWGVASGAGVAGYFEGGTAGRGIVVTTGASGFGTATPSGRLMVMQPATPVPAIDTFPAISGYSYTAQGCLKGGVSGSYNTSNYGVGVQGVGYNGVNNQDANTIFGVGNQDLGVYGSSNTAGVMGGSVGGIGVVGYNKNSSFAATTGVGNSYGIYGNAQTVGGATVPTTRYGIYGFASGATTNYAGYFSGNVQITGSIAKGSGTFKIDHPLDPENKYLYHSFVESPDMMNIYNGNITTDAKGYATVELPGYFDALNKDFRYQLTVIGTFAQAIVKEKVKGNKFVIQTNEPNVEVSWMVTGVRHDKYADAHRVVAEVDKEPELKGYYLHAKEWGVSQDRSMDAVTLPKDTHTIVKPAMNAPATSGDNAQQAAADPKKIAGVIIE